MVDRDALMIRDNRKTFADAELVIDGADVDVAVLDRHTVDDGIGVLDDVSVAPARAPRKGFLAASMMMRSGVGVLTTVVIMRAAQVTGWAGYSRR